MNKFNNLLILLTKRESSAVIILFISQLILLRAKFYFKYSPNVGNNKNVLVANFDIISTQKNTQNPAQ